MRSDHLSKHIKTHQNKKGGPGVALSVGTLPLDSGAGSEGSGAATSSALITTNMVAMEAICPEGIARLANSGINVMQVADLQSINISGNGFWDQAHRARDVWDIPINPGMQGSMGPRDMWEREPWDIKMHGGGKN